MLIKFRIKHPKLYKLLKEGGNFLFIFVIVFIIVFTIFNGRSFYEQTKYSLRIGVEKTEDFVKNLKLPTPKEKLYDVADSIVIPKINVNAPIVSAQTTNEKDLFNKLENGVVYYPVSVLPGQVGNTIILGHSSAYPWYKGNYGSIFSLLNRLEVDDQIIIFFQKHKYIYKVTNKQVVGQDTLITEQSVRPQLVLISCWPVGTAWKRIMVTGVLTSL